MSIGLVHAYEVQVNPRLVEQHLTVCLMDAKLLRASDPREFGYHPELLVEHLGSPDLSVTCRSSLVLLVRVVGRSE